QGRERSVRLEVFLERHSLNPATPRFRQMLPRQEIVPSREERDPNVLSSACGPFPCGGMSVAPIPEEPGRIAELGHPASVFPGLSDLFDFRRGRVKERGSIRRPSHQVDAADKADISKYRINPMAPPTTARPEAGLDLAPVIPAAAEG